MKDSRGHGSNTRGASMLTPAGRGIMPSRPYRQSSQITSGPPAPGSNGGIEHQASIAEQHGVQTDHLRVGDHLGPRYGWAQPMGAFQRQYFDDVASGKRK